jgi:hypothetical protein
MLAQQYPLHSFSKDGSGTDSQVNMSGMSDWLFSANPFILAGYGHVSFDDCQKCKFLYFRQFCFPQLFDQAGNVWHKGVSSKNKPGSVLFIDRQNEPWQPRPSWHFSWVQ